MFEEKEENEIMEEQENELLETSIDDIAFQFDFNGQRYALLTENEEIEDEAYLVKLEELEDGTLFVRAIDDDNEYNKAEEEFNRIIESLDILDEIDNEEDEDYVDE